ncbi:hypothetical protein D3C78_1572630 [compost metagenome]
MVKAWQGTAATRTWKATAEMIILIEPCKVYPALGKRAVALLSLAPSAAIGPGIMPALASQPWAVDVFKSWVDDPDVTTHTKKAIKAALRNGI